jgi:Fe-S-cluster containining protein
MVSRHLLFGDIENKAEEDLKLLLTKKNPLPQEFHYSPFILRSVNEKLLEEGMSIGLGFVSDRAIIDNYWSTISLPIEGEIEVRIIYGTQIGCQDELVIFIKNNEIKRKILKEISDIQKLKPKNNLVYRFRSILRNDDVDNICENIRAISYEKNVKLHTDMIYLERKEIQVNETKFIWNIPSKIKLKCKRCNLCELPSHYSVNPIPNIMEEEKNCFTFENRICFPCNLPTLSYNEIEDISKKKNLEIQDFSRPILTIEDTKSNTYDYLFALKQKNGLCIFQNTKNNSCLIHNISPLNCKSYPLMISDLSEKEIIIELDFSCPGITFESTINTLKKSKRYYQEINKRNELPDISFELLSQTWKDLMIWKDKERVKIDEVEIAYDMFFQEYLEYKEKMKTD